MVNILAFACVHIHVHIHVQLLMTYTHIYQLKLKKTSESSTVLSYLDKLIKDLDIQIYAGKFANSETSVKTYNSNTMRNPY